MWSFSRWEDFGYWGKMHIATPPILSFGLARVFIAYGMCINTFTQG